MARRFVSPTLVGRETEIAAVARALDGAIAGAPIHQLVSGEAGVGKSRLMAEATALAVAREMRVVTGGCADIGDGGVPFGPIVEALRALVRELDDEDVEEVFGSASQDLARLVPSLDPVGAADQTPQTPALQARLLDGVLAVIQRLAERSPVLFIVEDLHWADPATRETIAFLVRHLRTDRVLLVMTFRADELHRRHPLLPWLAELERSGRVERMDLQRFDQDQTLALLSAILDEPPTHDFAEQIHRRSDGNPFFVEELIGAGGDAVGGRLPPTLREVLLTRIVALPEHAQAVIGVAAVAGRRVDHDLLATVALMDEDDLIDGLRTAVGSQVLVTGLPGDDRDSDYAFRHALFQEAAYDDLLPGERQRLHRAFAEALAERQPGQGAFAAGHWGELAYHWSAARDDRRAFEALIRAGGAAASAFAFADARRHDEHALELWSTIDDPAELAGMDRVALLDRAATAAWLAGDPRRTVALRREAVAALGPDADPIRTGTVLEQLGRALWTNNESDAALEMCEAAVSVMPTDPPTPELARVLAGYGQLLMLLDRWSESRVQCERAVEMARKVGARQAEGHALNTLGLDLAVAGQCDEGSASLEAAIAIARDVADPDDIGRGYNNLAEAKRYCGDIRGAERVVREGIVATDEVGVASTYGRFIRANGIAYAFELGDWAEADRLADESVALEERGIAQHRYGLARWVRLLVAKGDQQADDRISDLREHLDGLAVEAQFNGPLRIATAESALWRGDADVALRTIAAALDELGGHERDWVAGRLHVVGLRAAADLAEVARARRDGPAEAEAIRAGDAFWEATQRSFEDWRGHRQGFGLEQAIAELATSRAEQDRLRRLPTAAVDWLEAAKLWQARGNPYLHAYCLWREAEAHLEEGDRTAAARSLSEAHHIASRLGAGPLRAKVEALAARSRLDLGSTQAPAPVTATTRASDDPFGLTRRERDVLPLLVKGRTNKQIAEELFISENTAGVHVSNILGKMGATTRTEAAGIAARLGLGVDDD